jgi:two-component system, sensor histidine kinase and response regulator
MFSLRIKRRLCKMGPLDLSLALEAADGDVDLMQAVIETFLEETPILLAELEQALRSNNAVVVQRASHTIKGNLRLFGNVPATLLAEQLESMGAEHDLRNGVETFDLLQDSLRTLKLQIVKSLPRLAENANPSPTEPK